MSGCEDNWFSMMREPVQVNNEVARRWLLRRAYGDESIEDGEDDGSSDTQIKYSKSYRHLELV